MTTGLVLISGMLGGGVLLLWVWCACVVGGRADDDMTRYFRTQQRRAQLRGCATRIGGPR